MPGLPPISHRTPKALPAGPTPPAAAPKKPVEAGKPAISGPTDPRKQPNGPNQLAGLLDRSPSQLKADTLHLQDRPQAFREGSAPTRMINGKQVSISAPILGMKLPGENAVARRESSPGGSQGSHGQDPSSNRPAFMGDQPSGRLAIEAPPSRSSKTPSDFDDHLAQNGLPPKLSQSEQNFQSMHLYQNNVQFTQHVHVNTPPGPPQAHAQPPAHGHPQQGAAKPNGTQDPHAQPAHDAEMPDAGDGEKKMGTGKKILIGLAAVTGLTFILPMFGSSSTPPPDGH
jgi:hypothetical protein